MATGGNKKKKQIKLFEKFRKKVEVQGAQSKVEFKRLKLGGGRS
jgi:hypothetical protein